MRIGSRIRSEVLRMTLGLVLVGLLTAIPASAYANPLESLGRGILNIIKAPAEIPIAVVNGSKDVNPFYGILVGPFAGVARGATRAIAGVVEIVAAPIPGSDEPMYDYPLGTSVFEEDSRSLVFRY